ncbi:hypothetical protein ACEN85_19885, partial [Curtobacterium sp. CT11-45]|uniref:hypothetical protein n=1 Tax=Curtobacterium sp. CT11-45 TaxID=3243037 RepID=UPI0039AEFCD7
STAAPALAGTALDRAQAAATIATAETIADSANEKTDTGVLERRIDALDDYRTLSGAALTSRISSTVDATTAVADASAAQDKQDRCGLNIYEP